MLHQKGDDFTCLWRSVLSFRSLIFVRLGVLGCCHQAADFMPLRDVTWRPSAIIR
jgi:hypothetical protein